MERCRSGRNRSSGHLWEADETAGAFAPSPLPRIATCRRRAAHPGRQTGTPPPKRARGNRPSRDSRPKVGVHRVIETISVRAERCLSFLMSTLRDLKLARPTRGVAPRGTGVITASAFASGWACPKSRR